MVLVFQSDLVAALLLHTLGQPADGDQATYAEPVWGPHVNLDPRSGCVKIPNETCSSSTGPGGRHAPCCDDVRKLRCVGSDLHCDWLKEHELLADPDCVSAGRHVLQPEGSILLADDWVGRRGKQQCGCV